MTKMWIMFCAIFLLPIDGAKNVSGGAHLNSVAEFRCTLEKLPSFSMDEVDIYWQRGKEVLQAMSLSDSSHISNRYRNRTVLAKDGALKMYNVSFEDQGVYTCILIVQSKKGREKVDDCSYRLDVYANYSEPEISYEPSFQMVDNGTTVHVKCNSGYGFPRPERIVWETSYGNDTVELTTFTDIKNISKTFNASSELSLKVEEDVNITCVLKAHHNVTSKVLQIVVKREIPPDTLDWSLIIILSVVFLVCFTAILITLEVRRRMKKQSVTTNRRGQEMGQVAAGSPEQCNLFTECETATDQ